MNLKNFLAEELKAYSIVISAPSMTNVMKQAMLFSEFPLLTFFLLGYPNLMHALEVALPCKVSF